MIYTAFRKDTKVLRINENLFYFCIFKKSFFVGQCNIVHSFQKKISALKEIIEINLSIFLTIIPAFLCMRKLIFSRNFTQFKIFRYTKNY